MNSRELVESLLITVKCLTVEEELLTCEEESPKFTTAHYFPAAFWRVIYTAKRISGGMGRLAERFSFEIANVSLL